MVEVEAPPGVASPPASKVLLVDDHRMFAELLSISLEVEADFSVVGVAGSGSEALEMATERHPDVVVLDYRLPGENGIRVANRLREALPGVQIVMLTGQEDDSLLRSALAAGCAGFVTKDKGIENLVGAVRAVCAGRIGIDAEDTTLLATFNPRGRGSARLTTREAEVLLLLADGVSTREIATRLFISLNTARNHVQRLIAKLGAHSRLEAVAVARRNGLLDDPRRS